ncbi:alpha/beta hydrolase [Listeria fleischmannii]|uniref:alpha/beta hydrolase n=1 Tax=Listeria fleischmannii TaxID=1069827 RepID=UPI0016256399|nr:alpha/beta hydrolase [Listeria fleischmannii]MBC1420128.1 alpha/beta hydrolase [Listeria fleischmannii]
MIKRILLAYLVPILCVGGAIFSLIALNPTRPEAVNTKIPTIFIHGYHGTDRSLHGMIRRFDQKYHVATDSMIVHVSKIGEISTEGEYNPNAKNPLINVVFDNNRATITQQAMWMKKVMSYLQKHEDITKFNAVAHSMGGGVWEAYLASYSKDPAYPSINKIVFLAVPLYPEEYINGDEQVDIRNEQEVHANFAERMAKVLPKNIPVLIIAGDLNDGTKSDGEVKVDSVLYGKKLFQSQKVETHVIKGPEASHSNMHELPAVDHYIIPFLFGK